MAKRTISAKELAQDIKAGQSYETLTTKYQVSEKTLDGFLQKLLTAGLVEKDELPVKLVKSFKCPACGTPQFEAICRDCGAIVSEFARKQRETTANFSGSSTRKTASYKLEQRRGFDLEWYHGPVMALVAVIVILGFGFLASIISSNKAQVAVQSHYQRQESAIRLNAGILFSDYKTNEVAADREYKGRLLAVDGRVDKVGKDIAGKMYVSLRSTPDEIQLGTIQCFFSDEKAQELATLKPGQDVVIEGRCGGKMFNVLLLSCNLKR